MRFPGAPQIDVARLAGAMARPGMDTRVWLSMAVVATVRNGRVDDTDASAVIVGPEGVEVDVVLLPDKVPTTCRFPSGGTMSTDDWPLRPGAELVVAIPEGVPGTSPVILGVLNSAADNLPVDTDGKPLFRHDRRLIWANGVPIDLRTGGARVLVDPAGAVTLTGNVYLGGPDASQRLILGDAYRPPEKQVMTILSTFADAVNVAIASASGPSPPQKAAVLAAEVALKAAIQVFNGSDYLSEVSRTK